MLNHKSLVTCGFPVTSLAHLSCQAFFLVAVEICIAIAAATAGAGTCILIAWFGEVLAFTSIGASVCLQTVLPSWSKI